MDLNEKITQSQDDILLSAAGVSGSVKRQALPFSVYQFVLFLLDYSIAVAAFWFFGSLGKAGQLLLEEEIFFYSLVMAGVMISFFLAYNLYSYHLIFSRSVHMKTLTKALCWACMIFALILAMYKWPVFFRQQRAVKAVFIFAGSLVLTILARFISSHIGKFIMAGGIGFIALGLNGLFLKDFPPPLVLDPFMGWAGIFSAWIAIAITRCFIVDVIYSKWLRRWFRRQLVVIGTDDEARKITQYIVETNPPFWVVGAISLAPAAQKMELSDRSSKEYLGRIDDLPGIVEEYGIQEVIVTENNLEKRLLISLLDYCLAKGIVVWFPPNLLPIIPVKIRIDQFCTIPMVRMCIQRNPGFFSAIKRFMDIAIAISALLVLFPLFLLIGIAIKLDSEGPVFYMAEAIGEGGRLFRMFKFRSMKQGGGPNPHREFVKKFIKGDLPEENKKNRVLKLTNDPRVTRVGRFLRKLSLDELPQLVNVLKGEMSLVGPRPCLPYEYDLYKGWHRKRNSVRPGITGLWQVTGRSEVLFEDMILLDLYYIYNRNLLLDIAILFETVYVVLAGKGAF